MQIMIDTPDVRRELMTLKTYALAHPIDLSAGLPPEYKPVGDIPQHVVVSGTTRIVYSIETWPTLGLCHHLSVSKLGYKPPNPEIIRFVMQLLGMGELRDRSLKRYISIEQGYAANIVQPFSVAQT